MLYPKILALATGVPAHRYTQMEIYERFLAPHLGANRRARAIFGRAGIKQRFTAVEGAYHEITRGTEERNLRYMQDAIPLGEQTICKTLQQADLAPGALDDLTVASCTGFDIPGLDLHLAGRLAMRPDLNRTCILGMGCYAAFPALRRARDAVMAAQTTQPARRALALCVELCSLHFQNRDDTENVVVSALFGDGAAAALVGFDEQSAGPQVVDLLTQCDYSTFEHMAFHVTDHGFQMELSSYVPALLGAAVEPFVDTLLARNGLRREDVRFWGVHPGGLKIMEHIERQLGLKPDDLRFARAVLRDYGNMSSPTVLFVLDEIQRNGRPQAGDHAVLMAFGPGLTMESCLLRW
ncbi:MAG: type III polyketide synthase [Chloroflexi bacterium]|nr:type III polyketide synthase [Chloroflexota bacterium]